MGDNELLESDTAAAMERIKGVKHQGVRAGKWLRKGQATDLLNVPDPSTLKGKRDRARCLRRWPNPPQRVFVQPSYAGLTGVEAHPGGSCCWSLARPFVVEQMQSPRRVRDPHPCACHRLSGILV
jgi:hypothetical protein